ncbi:sugar phosphate isomerase/epimerase family protein [Nocardia sp. NPDC004722]
MKLAIISDELSQDIEAAALQAARLGFGGLEIRSVGSVPPHLMTDEQLRAVHAIVECHGLRVAGFDPPALKCALPVNDTEIAAVRDLVVNAIRQAELLGAPFVRGFTFYRDGAPDPARAGRISRDVFDGVPLDTVPFLVETGTRSNTPTMRHMLEYLRALDDDRFGVLWDPGNTVFSGLDPTPFPDEYHAARDLIRHVHVKDPKGTSEYVRFGDGDVPWAAILETLAADGYDGWISLETHWRTDRVLTADERDQPWGEPFTRGGFEASVECMEILRALLDGVVASPARPR